MAKWDKICGKLITLIAIIFISLLSLVICDMVHKSSCAAQPLRLAMCCESLQHTFCNVTILSQSMPTATHNIAIYTKLGGWNIQTNFYIPTLYFNLKYCIIMRSNSTKCFVMRVTQSKSFTGLSTPWHYSKLSSYLYT